MKQLYYFESKRDFCVHVGAPKEYIYTRVQWRSLNLAKVRERNMKRCPKLWA